MLVLDGTGTDSFGSFERFILSGTLQSGDTLNNVDVLSYAGALPIGDPTLGAANTGSVPLSWRSRASHRSAAGDGTLTIGRHAIEAVASKDLQIISSIALAEAT